MKKENNKKFEEEYINQKAEKLALDYEFVKGFIWCALKEYRKSFDEFLEKYEKKINDFLSKLKISPKIGKNNYMLGQINFINNIPNLIKAHDGDFDVDYVFLKEHFLKLKTKKQISELQKNMDDLQKEIDVNSDEKSIFDVKQLYYFGNFILNFLTDFEVRKRKIVDLLNLNIKSKENEFKNIISSNVIMSKENNITNWKVANL